MHQLAKQSGLFKTLLGYMQMKTENILKALDYLLDNEHQHYLEFIEDNPENEHLHIYAIALQAKKDLLA
jgi:hypothetical protein